MDYYVFNQKYGRQRRSKFGKMAHDKLHFELVSLGTCERYFIKEVDPMY